MPGHESQYISLDQESCMGLDVEEQVTRLDVFFGPELNDLDSVITFCYITVG